MKIPIRTTLVTHTPQELSVLVCVPSPLSTQIVLDFLSAGVTRIWLSPGAENMEIQKYALQKGVELIHGGSELLEELKGVSVKDGIAAERDKEEMG